VGLARPARQLVGWYERCDSSQPSGNCEAVVVDSPGQEWRALSEPVAAWGHQPQRLCSSRGGVGGGPPHPRGAKTPPRGRGRGGSGPPPPHPPREEFFFRFVSLGLHQPRCRSLVRPRLTASTATRLPFVVLYESFEAGRDLSSIVLQQVTSKSRAPTIASYALPPSCDLYSSDSTHSLTRSSSRGIGIEPASKMRS
jgi:hypothetical protein